MPSLLIEVSRDLAQKLNREDSYLETQLGQILAHYGARLHGLSVPDEGQDGFFEVQQVAGDRMDALRHDLAGLPEVKAAYIKPDAELP